MATYASLTSLMHILEQIQNHPRLPITIDKQQIESLRENISFFQDFLENYSHEGGCIEAQGHLETQIADAAYAAEDVIESHIVDHILAGEKRSDDLFYQALQTSPKRKNTNTMVGFDDVLIQIMERLTGHPPARQVLDQSFLVLPSASLTRSLICNAKGGLASVTNFRLLRVFKATGKYFLEDVLQLVNSRYLDFRANWNSNAMLFSSIRLLWNLQTLIIKYIGGNQFVVPLEIWELSQLRHLEIDWHVLPDPPNAPGDDGLILRNLQTLLGTTNFKLSEEVTKRIPNIKKLQLYYVDCPKGWARNYCVNNLGRLNQLKSLVCKFMLEENLNNRNEFRLNFSFPSSLKKLILFGTHLHWTDMKMIGELPLLEILKLKIGSFHGSEWNPVEGEFPCLKFLLIARCEDLVTWTANSTHFPCLEHLVLKHLILLKEVPSDIGEIPTLQSIKLSHCSVSAVISAKNIQQEQEKFGNVGLQIRVCCKEKTEILESLESDNFQVKILTR